MNEVIPLNILLGTQRPEPLEKGQALFGLGQRDCVHHAHSLSPCRDSPTESTRFAMSFPNVCRVAGDEGGSLLGRVVQRILQPHLNQYLPLRLATHDLLHDLRHTFERRHGRVPVPAQRWSSQAARNSTPPPAPHPPRQSRVSWPARGLSPGRKNGSIGWIPLRFYA
jgi:hypothetical protein